MKINERLVLFGSVTVASLIWLISIVVVFSYDLQETNVIVIDEPFISAYNERNTKITPMFEQALDEMFYKYDVMYYMERIPDEFNKAFIYHTESTREHRMNFYSLMTVESVYFQWYVSRPNTNGSRDYGPSQLNQTNIENPHFMKCFAPVDNMYIDTLFTEYMIVSYNFYLDLYSSFGPEYVFYTYNGGPKAERYIRENLSPESTFVKNITSYNSKIRNAIAKHTIEYENYIMENVISEFIMKYGRPDELMKYFNNNDIDYDVLTIAHMCKKYEDDLLNKSIISDFVYDSSIEESEELQTVDLDNVRTDCVGFPNYFRKNSLVKREDEILIVSLQHDGIFDTVHIFFSNGYKTYIGCHYLFELGCKDIFFNV